MRYQKLSISKTPKQMNTDLVNFYGYGLYEFSVVFALINEKFGIYNPYYRNKKTKGLMILSEHIGAEFINQAQVIYSALETYCEQKGRVKNLSLNLEPDIKNEVIKENYDYKIGLYQNGWDFILPTKTLQLYKKGKIKLKSNGIIGKKNWLSSSMSTILPNLKIRDRIVGTWAGIMRESGGIHWENLSELLCWFLHRFPISLQNMIGDPGADLLKKQYSRKKERAGMLFDFLENVCFPKARKKPIWPIYLSDKYILWIWPKIYSLKYLTWIKDNVNKIEDDKNNFFENKRIIGLAEIRNLFEKCTQNHLRTLPLISFPNGEYFN